MRREIPEEYQTYIEKRSQSLLGRGAEQSLTYRGLLVGCFLSLFLAVGAPYANMIIRGTYMALDFSTPGAIFLFLVLIGLLNTFLKAARRPLVAGIFAGLATALWLWAYWPCTTLDIYSPGLLWASFMLGMALLSVPVALSGGSLALNRSELVLVYAMLLIVSALCTMGLSEQILPMLTAIFYYASPQNKWAEKLLPLLPKHHIMVDDGHENQSFYEGLSRTAEHIPYAAWVEPLLWWGLFLLALYITMVSVAVILRRQWMERERLPYPIAQVGLSMVRHEDSQNLLNGFFARPAMWLGSAIPLFFGSLTALHRYNAAYPAVQLSWTLPLVGSQRLQLAIHFALVGFSYLINANIAAGIWFFHILSHFEKEIMLVAGLRSTQKITYGVADFPFLAYQGVGALLVMVLVGLWVGREHYRNVLLKALGRAPLVDDSDEILSYRGAVLGAVGGTLTMAAWLALMGTPAWIALVFVVTSLLIFVGVTRVVAEAGLAVVRAPMVAPDLVIQGLGAGAVGPAGVFNLSLTYLWVADIRVFVMATCTNALRLIQEMEPRNRRLVFWALIVALFIGSVGSFWMIFHMAYRHGGINLNSWFFKGAPFVAYSFAARHLQPTGPDWPGLGFLTGGGLVMALMMFARQRLPWWPFHPLGFPLGANSMMDQVWFSVFLAWALKHAVLKFGGARLYGRSQAFFLGLIAGQALCSGLWLVIDYFTGRVGNSVFTL